MVMGNKRKRHRPPGTKRVIVDAMRGMDAAHALDDQNLALPDREVAARERQRTRRRTAAAKSIAWGLSK